MTRIKRGVTARFRHKKILRKTKGYYSARSRVYRVAYQAFVKAHQYSYRDRKKRKQQFRKLWIIRINAAVRNYGMNYSKFMYLLKKLSINMNRKILSEIAFSDKKTFEILFKKIENS